MQAMDELRLGGIEDIGLITDPKAGSERARGEDGNGSPRPSRRRQGRPGGGDARQRGDERHAAHRRAPGAPRHLHGRVEPDAGGVDINLPVETKTANQTESLVSQILLDYSADRRISINKQDVTVQELQSRLRDIYSQRKDKTMFIAGAESLRYGDIVEVIDAAKGAGVEKVGIVTAGMRKAAGVGRQLRQPVRRSQIEKRPPGVPWRPFSVPEGSVARREFSSAGDRSPCRSASSPRPRAPSASRGPSRRAPAGGAAGP